MNLNSDEAICLVLNFAKDNRISSKTKLNKLIARLNLHFIPLDVKFGLNEHGSFAEELPEQSCALYGVEEYEYKGKTCHAYSLNDEGRKSVDSVIMVKLRTMLDESEIQELQTELRDASQMDASEISEDEHRKLLVDTEDRFKLVQRANSVHIELLDLYEEIKKQGKETLAQIKLAALIEYSYYLTQYLREKFLHLPEKDYNYDAHMIDYYFLYNIESVLPFLKSFVESASKDIKRITRYYDYIITSCDNYDYAFSLQNQHLKDLIVE